MITRLSIAVGLVAALAAPALALQAADTGRVDVGELKDVGLVPGADGGAWVVMALAEGGIRVTDRSGRAVDSVIAGEIASIDTLQVNGTPIVAAADESRGLHLFELDPATGGLTRVNAGDGALDLGFQPIHACLSYQGEEDALYAFAADERGRTVQFRLMEGDGGRTARAIRTLDIGGETLACAADDAAGVVYVAEPGVAIWAFESAPEAEPVRTLVTLAEPFGALSDTVSVSVSPSGHLAVLSDGVVNLIDPEDGAIIGTWTFDEALYEPEGMGIGAGLIAVASEYDDDSGDGGLFQIQPLGEALPGAEAARPTTGPDRSVALVRTALETEPVGIAGDAADDPAVWRHPEDPARSLILGTNKKAGLHIYDLSGDEVQFLSAGRINNVDVRYGFELESGRTIDFAMATNRSTDGMTVWEFDAETGVLSEIGAGPLETDMESPYGFCLYHDETRDAFYAFANSKSGEVAQWRLTAEAGDRIGVEEVRRFEVGSITEGCTADDQRNLFYIGEENVAIWRYGARPEDGEARTAVDRVEPDGRLENDIEGVSLYRGEDGTGYLIASIQGRNEYAVYEREGDNAFRGFFRIASNPQAGYDGAAETDGLDLISADMGDGFEDGFLVVHDGRNVEPQEGQNYKLVPWSEIAEALGLE